MAGYTHYLNLYSHETLSPISYEGTDSWLQDLLTCIQDPQVGEEAGFLAHLCYIN
jgi:hypothetical protein